MAFSNHHRHLPLYNNPNNPYNPTLVNYPYNDYLSFHYPVHHHYYNIINLPPNFSYQQQQQQHYNIIMYPPPVTYFTYPSRNSNVIHRVDDSWVLDQQEIISFLQEQTDEDSAPTASSFLQEETTAILDEDDDTSSVEIEPNYEDILLFEQILMGQVNSGLSVETIMQHLKTRHYIAAATEDEGDICVICQSEYENEELIGGLHCGHEYHEQCIIRWLQQNNTCPICKAAAVS